ncbi:hypothetical protein QBZ16_001761 [Prototheca wickerhamii]|uniref:CHRD domain-containing protein n=1 Tax=Prototheca wickerhamii TaxID=3111 RepID=A0AAD9ID86_PROWI|nr:hypothetical protein QBZ16_001761 [Prototheca wickerhamii]
MALSNFLKALALLSLTLCVASAEFEFIFKTTVDGESNIPVLTDAQTGGAKAYFDVIWEGDYFTWYMEVEGIQNMTMAHIHMFANGSLAMYHHPLTGSFSYAGNFTAADFLAPIDGEEAEDLFILMALGKAYVNIHTTAFPAGMLRGNLVANLTEWLGA